MVLGAQIAIAALMPVLPEEAYHWNFARHLDWGYYDHPPMIAWSIALGRLLLGDTPLGIRLIPLGFSLGTSWLLARLARCIYGGSAAVWSVRLYALMPAAFFIGGWGFPDAPVLFFWALALTCVWQAFETRLPGWWLAAGGALGAGMLPKYTAAFLVPAVFLYLLCSRRDRHWLASPWPYLAGVCSLVVFSPVIYWNWTHDWVSFRFQSTARFQAAHTIQLSAGLQSMGEQWLFTLPCTLPLAVFAVRRTFGSTLQAERFLFWSFAPMALFFFLLGWTPSWHVLWSLPAFLSLTVLMAGTLAHSSNWIVSLFRARWRWLAGLEAGFAILIVLHAVCILPGMPRLRETYGWQEAAAQARVLRDSLPEGSFYLAVGGRPYPPASQLAFHLNTPDQVYGENLIGREALQYRFWADPGRFAGKDAVVVIEGDDPTGNARQSLRPFFETLEPAIHLVTPIGRKIFWPTRSAQFTLLRARGYHPPSSNSKLSDLAADTTTRK
jgi:dolichol-phosphate mannosyltransferase